MSKESFYDPRRSYEENYENGPYGDFANPEEYEDPLKPPKEEFLGHKVHLPFGVPAGPLLNSNYIKGAFENGFDIAVYKTVRADTFPCHPFPNVLGVNIDGDLKPGREEPIVATDRYEDPLSITNSFGVPSKTPDVWQQDVERAASYQGEGQALVLSFMGTTREDQTPDEFIEDFALAAKLANETSAPILEANLSCPNIGNEGLVCYDLETTRRIADAIRNEIGDKPLALKVGYYQNEDDLKKLAEIGNEYADSVSSINTIPAAIVDEEGNQALPGSPSRRVSGVCGSAIKWAGLEQVKKLKEIRDNNGYNFAIEGVGGVTTPEDYFEYKNMGADSVMSATGAMWNPDLAKRIKEMV